MKFRQREIKSLAFFKRKYLLEQLIIKAWTNYEFSLRFVDRVISRRCKLILASFATSSDYSFQLFEVPLLHPSIASLLLVSSLRHFLKNSLHALASFPSNSGAYVVSLHQFSISIHSRISTRDARWNEARTLIISTSTTLRLVVRPTPEGALRSVPSLDSLLFPHFAVFLVLSTQKLLLYFARLLLNVIFCSFVFSSCLIF